MAYQNCIDHGKPGNHDGYAMHSRRINGKQPRLHRLVYAEANGLDEATMGGVVMHSCDNPRCINPDHLTLGTQAENIADRQAKGRQARGATWNAHHGEQHYQAKLTQAIVDECRRVYIPRHREYGARALADKYGVVHQVMSAALRGKTWRRA